MDDERVTVQRSALESCSVAHNLKSLVNSAVTTPSVGYHAHHNRQHPAPYVFDLLHLDGFDTRAAPLIERKRVLQSFLAEADTRTPRVLYSEHFEDGADLYARAIGMSLEGSCPRRLTRLTARVEANSGSR